MQAAQTLNRGRAGRLHEVKSVHYHGSYPALLQVSGIHRAHYAIGCVGQKDRQGEVAVRDVEPGGEASFQIFTLSFSGS